MRAFPDVPTLPYAAARSHIQNGDILLCSGTAFFSTMIQRYTRSVWSHVGVLLWRENVGRLMVMESVESKGTQTIPLHRYLINYRHTGAAYPGRVFVARHAACASVTPAQWITLEQYALDHLDYDYDDQEKWRILACIIAPKLAQDFPSIAQAKAFICSVYGAAIFASINIAIPWNPRGYIAPADYPADPAIQVLWELVP